MTYRTRKRLSLLLLAVGLPAYAIAALWIVSLFDRPPIWVELAVYAGLGVLWALPFRRLFLGVARPNPEEAEGPGGRRRP